MKKIGIFIAGMASGIVLLILISLLFTATRQADSNAGITLFKNPGNCISKNHYYRVFQVLDSGHALAKTGYGLEERIVLFLKNERTYYYDDQDIVIPSGKYARQIGVFRYETNFGPKTVPIVGIYNQ